MLNPNDVLRAIRKHTTSHGGSVTLGTSLKVTTKSAPKTYTSDGVAHAIDEAGGRVTHATIGSDGKKYNSHGVFDEGAQYRAFVADIEKAEPGSGSDPAPAPARSKKIATK